MGKPLIAITKAYPQLNIRWFLNGEGESGLDIELPVVEAEDPEKELLKEELLGMLEEKVRMLEREIKVNAPDLAQKLKIL